MKLLVKIGGAALEQPAPRARFAGSVAAALAAGHQLVLVHGGGNQVGDLTRRLGLETRRIAGLRVTDAATAGAVLQVLGGEVGRKLAAALVAAGVPALSLTGADGGLFCGRPLEHPAGDLGFVGEIESVDVSVIERLIAVGFVPSIASVCPSPGTASSNDGDDQPFLNINADHAVAPIAAAWKADAVLFLSDVPGVLDAQRKTQSDIFPAGADALVREGIIAGGMLPKVDAALAAARANPDALIKIASAENADAVLCALQPHVGTQFHAEVSRA